MNYICKRCDARYDDSYEGWRCKCGGSLWLDWEVKFSREDIRKNDFTLWRYDKAFPIKKEDLVSTFGEGMTPLTEESWDDFKIYIKNDALMPTGSFKDRGVVMMINYLALKGIKVITEDSSGNAGASVAEYASKAGMDCSIFAPEGTSEGKVAQVISSKAKLNLIAGPRENTARAAQTSIEGFYASHNWNPYFIEGVKSMAYEIWEQMGFSAPDNIICPIGNGSIGLGLAQGFNELLANGEVDKLPRIFGVQSENRNSVYREFHGIKDEFEPKPTIAEGIALLSSSKSKELVEAIRATKGEMVQVTEEDIIKALKAICKKGYYIEPTSATAFAGASHLIRDKKISPKDKTVVIVSGNGLKASEKILKYINI
jgi:threonine synthase